MRWRLATAFSFMDGDESTLLVVTSSDPRDRASIDVLNENFDPHVYLKLITSNGAIDGEGELKQSDY